MTDSCGDLAVRQQIWLRGMEDLFRLVDHPWMHVMLGNWGEWGLQCHTKWALSLTWTQLTTFLEAVVIWMDLGLSNMQSLLVHKKQHGLVGILPGINIQ